jgi:predicted  nucleic acid-binding Zn-ribbon protein
MAHENLSALRKRCADLEKQLVAKDARINELETEIDRLEQEMDEDFEAAEDERLGMDLDDEDDDEGAEV